MSDDLKHLVETATRDLHGIASRTDPARVAAEVVRLNTALRDAAAPLLTWSDQPQDFAAALLRNADPSNG